MVFLVLFAALLVVVVLPRVAQRRLARLQESGLPARGLVLSASATFTEVRLNGRVFERRAVVLDVEVMGRPPYEVSLTTNFPRMCESFPGAALDLRVDPRRPKNLTVVGPAGATHWMGATAGLFPWAPARGGGCGTAVLVVVLALLALGAVISLAR